MLLGIGVFSFMLGLALLLLAAVLMTLDILWSLEEIIFKIGIILMFGPIIIALLTIGIFGFILLI